MIIPILFVLGLAIVGVKLGEKLRSSDFRVGAAMVPRLDWVAHLDRTIASGKVPSDFQINEAIREAFDRGDWGTVNLISSSFLPNPKKLPDKPEANEPTPQAQEAAPNALKSPVEGVVDDDWADFVAALRTKEFGYRGQRHIGAWEQNLGRLKQLGIAPPENEESQYEALVADISEHVATQDKLLSDSSGEVVTIPGKANPDSQDGTWPVTLSGILGLLKSAGPSGARGWIENESDRTRYPHTTATFIKTNGIF